MRFASIEEGSSKVFLFYYSDKCFWINEFELFEIRIKLNQIFRFVPGTGMRVETAARSFLDSLMIISALS